MWSSSAPEVIILDKETSKDRNHYKAKGAGCFWIMGNFGLWAPVSALGSDTAILNSCDG